MDEARLEAIEARLDRLEGRYPNLSPSVQDTPLNQVLNGKRVLDALRDKGATTVGDLLQWTT